MSASTDRPTRIAIACRGGGSHTGFTAGVPRRFLYDRDELAAISGRSGGAFDALVARYGLVTDGSAAARDIAAAVGDGLAATGASPRPESEWLTGLAPFSAAEQTEVCGRDSPRRRLRPTTVGDVPDLVVII